MQVRVSIMVSISACHADDPGSIPGRGARVSERIPEIGAPASAYSVPLQLQTNHDTSVMEEGRRHFPWSGFRQLARPSQPLVPLGVLECVAPRACLSYSTLLSYA